MAKTIEEQLKELNTKENRLKNQQKELKKLRQKLEAEKKQEEAKHQETEPYVEKFKELGLNVNSHWCKCNNDSNPTIANWRCQLGSRFKSKKYH